MAKVLRPAARVFFLSFGFALTSMFENVCGNAVAGSIDLAGLFPNYINILRGADRAAVAAGQSRCDVYQCPEFLRRLLVPDHGHHGDGFLPAAQTQDPAQPYLSARRFIILVLAWN